MGSEGTPRQKRRIKQKPSKGLRRNGPSQRNDAIIRVRREPDDFCAHENPSHTAIAIRPASEIRYAVIGGSLLELSLRHDREGDDHFGREPISLKTEGPRAVVAFMPRRVPSRSRAPANLEGVTEARTAARLRRSDKVRLGDVAP